MSIIEVRDIRKVYRVDKEKIVALNRINLSIEQGEICCILGTSGSGKSTLLNIMAGLEKPSKGSVVIDKTDITKMSEKQLALFRQKNIGFVFQSYNLMPTLTAIENVAMPLMFRGMNKRERTKSAVHILNSVKLHNRLLHKPTQMSGGQQQRVGIARAFVARPKIVFADEPTGNLDSKTSRDVMKIMINMARTYHETLIIVTHDRDIANYADRIVSIFDGNIKSDVPNESVLLAPSESQNEFVEQGDQNSQMQPIPVLAAVKQTEEN